MTDCGPFGFRTDDLTAPKGVDYGWMWKAVDANGDPVDITGWSAIAQARANVDASGPPRAEWTEGNGITLSGDELTLILDPAETATWEWDRAVYEIHVSSPTDGPFYFTGGNLRMKDSVIR